MRCIDLLLTMLVTLTLCPAAEKLFTDSAFYDDPEHKYPTVEEQIALARQVARSVLAPVNANSRGHKMFVRRRERSARWVAGYKPSDDEQQVYTRNESVPIQLAQCWFPQLAISDAKI